MSFSISEIMVVLLVALLVIKPDQLPEVAYNFGKLARHVRRIFSSARNEVRGLIDSVEKVDEHKS